MSLSVSCTDNVSTDSMIKKMQEAREYEVDQLPEYKHDPNYHGKEYDTDLRCLCQRRPARRVASSGVNTGRRFLGCPKKWVKCHFVKWVDPEWDELAAKTIFSLSERNIALQKSLDDVNKSWMSLYARKMRKDDLWSRKLADARIDRVDHLDKIKSIGDDLVKIKLIGLVVMVTLFVSAVAKLGW